MPAEFGMLLKKLVAALLVNEPSDPWNPTVTDMITDFTLYASGKNDVICNFEVQFAIDDR